MDRDTEVLKIQIIADFHHSTFTAYASFLFSLVIGWFLVAITLLFQGIFPFFEVYVFFLVIGFIPLFVVLYLLIRDYAKNLDGIDKLIQHVNNGEPRPSLRELRKKPKLEKKT